MSEIDSDNRIDSYKEYLSQIRSIYKKDTSNDICIHSYFKIKGKKCSHKLIWIEDGNQTVMLTSKFEYDEYFKKNLLIPAIVGYAKRNPMLDTVYSPMPKSTSKFKFESYSNDGNVLTISGIDSSFVKEIDYNIKQIPAVKFNGYKSEKVISKTQGYIGILELLLLTFVVTTFVGIVIALQIME